MIADTYCATVAHAAGFSETDLPDDSHVYLAVRFLMHDAAVEKTANEFAIDLLNQRRSEHASTEPPLSMGMPDEAFVEWIEWLEKAENPGGRQPYESLLLALSMLKPKEKGELRARVLAKIKEAEATEQ
jgi:hypothetical protein